MKENERLSHSIYSKDIKIGMTPMSIFDSTSSPARSYAYNSTTKHHCYTPFFMSTCTSDYFRSLKLRQIVINIMNFDEYYSNRILVVLNCDFNDSSTALSEALFELCKCIL
ncbi:unnamed protein product [Lepeophtheirus salmonis]|uniref:(salmon louse) hypothetical protein n=1 Tax=Lepeophtheirus salmonis TaxID=72036 RepID=A0A7R8CMP3_LEPSM|nr:unnamed protein product [Lepeophtheirus salmonis]CAF2839222.1 unnamed protein product [Lepeophtheirus salmonis]